MTTTTPATDVRCSVCSAWFERPTTGTGRRRIYCSRACRERAYRDRADGQIRLFPDTDRPPPMVRPGLRRVGPGHYETRDGGLRIVARRPGPGWLVEILAGGGVYVEGSYPRLRDARAAVGVTTRGNR